MPESHEPRPRPSSGSGEPLPGFRRGVENLQSIKEKLQRREKTSDKVADLFTRFSGSMAFVYIHGAWFGGWILWNLGRIPGLKPFDPFPFGLLTMIVSLEAIFLSTFVLVSQNREQKVSAIRDDLETQIALYQEQELTQVLRIVHRIEKHLGLHDEEEAMVRAMEHFVNADTLFRQMEVMIEREGEAASDPSGR